MFEPQQQSNLENKSLCTFENCIDDSIKVNVSIFQTPNPLFVIFSNQEKQISQLPESVPVGHDT